MILITSIYPQCTYLYIFKYVFVFSKVRITQLEYILYFSLKTQMIYLNLQLFNSLYALICNNNSYDIYQMIMRLASLVAQLVKNLPTMQETLILLLLWEDPLEKG